MNKETHKQNGREISDIEKALGFIPSYVEMHSFDNSMSPTEKYRRLRTIELAYQQLQESGIDVSKELMERRYQILECALDVFSIPYDLIRDAVEARKDEIGDKLSLGDLRNSIEVLSEYIKKIFPKEEIGDIESVLGFDTKI